MAITRKDTKAMLALAWMVAADAYEMGYRDGSNGQETPSNYWTDLASNAHKALEGVTAQELNEMAKRITNLGREL